MSKSVKEGMNFIYEQIIPQLASFAQECLFRNRMLSVFYGAFSVDVSVYWDIADTSKKSCYEFEYYESVESLRAKLETMLRDFASH